MQLTRVSIGLISVFAGTLLVSALADDRQVLVDHLTPNSGQVGSTIQIVGEDLWEATAVQFNGMPAKFSVATDNLIWATVPAGATSGPITIIKPHGVRTKLAKFQVQPKAELDARWERK